MDAWMLSKSQEEHPLFIMTQHYLVGSVKREEKPTRISLALSS